MPGAPPAVGPGSRRARLTPLIQQLATVDLIVNPKTAATLGLTTLQSVLPRANEVIR